MRWAGGVGGMLDLMVATLLIKNCRKTSQVVWETSRLVLPVGVRIRFMVSNRTFGLWQFFVMRFE